MQEAVAQGGLARDEYDLWLEAWLVMSVCKHERAFLSGGGYAISAPYGRSRTRDGSHVAVTYETPSGDLKPYVRLPKCSTICDCNCPALLQEAKSRT